jgi:hypothetical protein
MHPRASRRTGQDRLKFWLALALLYPAGTLGLGWLTGHYFKLWQWALLTAKMTPRLIRLITHR